MFEVVLLLKFACGRFLSRCIHKPNSACGKKMIGEKKLSISDMLSSSFKTRTEGHTMLLFIISEKLCPGTTFFLLDKIFSVG